MEDSLANIGLYLVYFLIGLSFIAIIGFSILQLVQNPKKAKMSLIGIGAIVVVFLICYGISSDAVMPKYAQFGVGASQSKLIGAGLITFYLLGIGGVLAAVYVEVARFFK